MKVINKTATLTAALIGISSISFTNESQAWSLFGYSNFAECEKKKTLEYLDDGRNAASFDARAYCDIKFPILPPEYKKIFDVSGEWKCSNSYYSKNKNTYETNLNKRCEKLSFIATMENEEDKKFSNVSTSGYSKTTVKFETPSPTKKVTITEAFINVNRNKRKGD